MSRGEIPYVSAWDAMGAQAAEDFAIWRLRDLPPADGSAEYLEALHLNCPGHWAAQDKIGKDFAAVHRPVSYVDPVLPWVKSLLEGVLHKGPFTRFAWDVGPDRRLNHHPDAPDGISADDWKRKRFNPLVPNLFVRVERQILVGFPEINRALFFIRTYFHDVRELKKSNPQSLKGLHDSIEGMTAEMLAYKNLNLDQEGILRWLKKLLTGP